VEELPVILFVPQSTSRHRTAPHLALFGGAAAAAAEASQDAVLPVLVACLPGGPWFCVLPEEAWPEDQEHRASIQAGKLFSDLYCILNRHCTATLTRLQLTAGHRVTCSTTAIHLLYTCSTTAVHLQFTCGTAPATDALDYDLVRHHTIRHCW
jgi:hypothetical protein